MKINLYTLEKNEKGHPVMVAEPSKHQIDGRCRFDRPDRIVNLAEKIGISRRMEEYLYILCLDTKLHFLGFCEVSHGNVVYSIVDCKSIFQRALLLGAANIILLHNHPSGECSPSKEDIQCTQKVMKAGELLDISVLDHIIIGNREFYSIKENKKNLRQENKCV